MNSATLAVLLTFGGTIVMAISGIVIAVIANNRERRTSAEKSAEKLEEKWRAFKDDQIQALRTENADLRMKWADAEARADREEARADHLKMVLDDKQERINDGG